MKLKKNKYIEELGVKRRNHSANFLKGLDYEKECKKYEKKYGINPAETFDMGRMLVEWVYTHLKEYKKRAEKVIDLDAIKRKCYDGVERTENECIEYIIEKLARFIVVDNDVNMESSLSELEVAQEDVKKAFYLLADIWYDLWW